MAQPLVAKSCMTRKNSEFGVVRPKAIKITSCYQIFEKLGEGTTAVVRRCIDKRDGKEYAIKIIRKTRLTLLDVSALLEEVSILAHLRHPHVIRFHDFVEDPWYFYVVTELMSGGELFDRIAAKTTYTEREARDLFRVLVGTIEYLHSCHVVHRDIKPENLLLADRETDCSVKLADFGYAVQVWPDEPGLRSQCGTPCYIAPEILLQKQGYGTPADMWSTGVVLYILLCGYAPFYDENQGLLFEKIKRGSFCFDEDAWGDTSDEAKALIRGLLELDPKKRLTAKQALRHPWMLADENKLNVRTLSKAQAEMLRFNARRMFRIGVRSIIAVNRIQRSVSERKSRLSSQPSAPSLPSYATPGAAVAAADGDSRSSPSSCSVVVQAQSLGTEAFHSCCASPLSTSVSTSSEATTLVAM